jgi:hypothetical protein
LSGSCWTFEQYLFFGGGTTKIVTMKADPFEEFVFVSIIGKSQSPQRITVKQLIDGTRYNFSEAVARAIPRKGVDKIDSLTSLEVVSKV